MAERYFVITLQLDYAILHQLLLESDVTLHILMNEDFMVHKARVNKIFFGKLLSCIFVLGSFRSNLSARVICINTPYTYTPYLGSVFDVMSANFNIKIII